MLKIFIRNLFFLIFFSPKIFADIEGKIFRIVDADTVVIQTDQGFKHKVRLLGIDAPEIKQVMVKMPLNTCPI